MQRFKDLAAGLLGSDTTVSLSRDDYNALMELARGRDRRELKQDGPLFKVHAPLLCRIIEGAAVEEAKQLAKEITAVGSEPAEPQQ